MARWDRRFAGPLVLLGPARRRFIEYIPIGAEAWEQEKVFFAHGILGLLGREVSPLALATGNNPRFPATDGDGRRLRRRRRVGRNDRVGELAVLREL